MSICKNCGQDYQLHNYESDACPLAGGKWSKLERFSDGSAEKKLRDQVRELTEAANELSHSTARQIAEMKEALAGYEEENIKLLAENERLHKQISALILLDSAKF